MKGEVRREIDYVKDTATWFWVGIWGKPASWRIGGYNGRSGLLPWGLRLCQHSGSFYHPKHKDAAKLVFLHSGGGAQVIGWRIEAAIGQVLHAL